MKTLKTAVLAVTILIISTWIGYEAKAQYGSSAAIVQQTATHQDAATFVASNGTTNSTTTITPPSGQYVYVTGLDIENCASGTNVTAAAQNAITTTNLSGAQWQISVGPLAGACTPTVVPVMPTALKSATAGTAVTFVVPTFGTNQTLRLNVYYYFGY